MTEKATPLNLAFPLPANWSFDPEMAAQVMNARGHGGFLGIRYLGHGEDWVEMGLPWREDLVGVPETGVLASGPIIALLDNVTSMAAWQRRGAFVPQATLDLRIDYIRAGTPGKTLIGRGECYQLKRSIGFVRGVAYEDDIEDPVAHAVGIFMLVGS